MTHLLLTIPICILGALFLAWWERRKSDDRLWTEYLNDLGVGHLSQGRRVVVRNIRRESRSRVKVHPLIQAYFHKRNP